MHAMKFRVQAQRPARVAPVEPCHWSEGRHNNVGVSLRERRATREVMLGVSLRARWDATLIYTIIIVSCRVSTVQCSAVQYSTVQYSISIV